MKVSQLYGKRIESADKKTHGVILGVSCAENVIEGYICFDEQENEFFASAVGARNLKDKVTFKKLGKENKCSYRLRLGLPVYSQSGKLLGSLSDCTVKGGKLTAIFCKNKKYPISRLNISDAVIVKSAAKRPTQNGAETNKQNVEIAAKDMFIRAICGD